MKMDLMSSEESCEEDGEEVIIVHSLPWISSRVAEFKRTLDSYTAKSKSPQARRQMKKRVIGKESSRPVPGNFPEWAIKR